MKDEFHCETCAGELIDFTYCVATVTDCIRYSITTGLCEKCAKAAALERVVDA